jgi:hypothetical protein
MEELLELKEKLIKGDIEAAIALCDELETMSRQDKINILESFLVVLLVHLIKIQVEQRITPSWYKSIRNSLLEIKDRNKLGKKSHYILQGQWEEHFESKLYRAIIKASEEIFGGIKIEELKARINYDALKRQTLEVLNWTYIYTEEEIVNLLEQVFNL